MQIMPGTDVSLLQNFDFAYKSISIIHFNSCDLLKAAPFGKIKKFCQTRVLKKRSPTYNRRCSKLGSKYQFSHTHICMVPNVHRKNAKKIRKKIRWSKKTCCLIFSCILAVWKIGRRSKAKPKHFPTEISYIPSRRNQFAFGFCAEGPLTARERG